MKKRVVITGMGIVSPLGCDVDEAYQNAINGFNGVREIGDIGAIDELPIKIAGQVTNFEPLKHLSKKDLRRQDPYSQYIVYSAKEAMEDAGLTPENHNSEEMGVIMGAGIGGITTIERDLRISYKEGTSKVPTMFVPMIIPNMGAGNVAIACQAKGSCSSVSTACASGTTAIGEAYRYIVNGYGKLMIAGGSEAAISPCTISGFNVLKTLSRTNDPNTASRPFDKNRDGFVIGEGAGAIILEDLEHAKARGAKIYAEIAGYGATCDAYHITAPSGDGAQRAIKFAINEAGLEPDAVDYINAHGTSTKLNDEMETQAIKSVFKDHAYKLSVSSTKSMHGHALGATGAIEAILTVKTILNGVVPPTINYETPEEGLDLDYTPNVSKTRKVDVAMSNSFGFGGHNAVLLFKKYQEEL